MRAFPKCMPGPLLQESPHLRDLPMFFFTKNCQIVTRKIIQVKTLSKLKGK
jgi:hypothetical protein